MKTITTHLVLLDLTPDNLAYVGFLLAIATLVFLALREFFCWYWKINQLLINQKEQVRLLKKIAGEKEVDTKEKIEPKSDLSFIKTEYLPPQ